MYVCLFFRVSSNISIFIPDYLAETALLNTLQWGFNNSSSEQLCSDYWWFQVTKSNVSFSPSSCSVQQQHFAQLNTSNPLNAFFIWLPGCYTFFFISIPHGLFFLYCLFWFLFLAVEWPTSRIFVFSGLFTFTPLVTSVYLLAFYPIIRMAIPQHVSSLEHF